MTTCDMTVGRPGRNIIRFALPLIGGYILQQMYLIIDAAIVGRWIGVEALAAVGASSSIMFLIMGFCNGACAGFSIPVAQRFGAKDFRQMRCYVANAVRISVVIAVVLTLLTCCFCERILKVVNTPHEILHDAWVYLFFQFLAITFTIGYNPVDRNGRGRSSSCHTSCTGFCFLFVSPLYHKRPADADTRQR